MNLASVLPVITALALLTAAAPALAQAAPPTQASTNEQVIVPQVERRDVTPVSYASRDFALGLFVGSYATANFGSSTVSGLRGLYHVTEDVFVEASYGRGKVSDEAFRQIFPNGGIFPTPQQDLSYYNVLAGYNLLPGEVFFGRGNARLSQGYVLAGVGSTDFAGQKRQTLTAGFGLRLLLSQRFTLQADMRDHVYSLDLLGKRQSNQNLEVTAGLTVNF